MCAGGIHDSGSSPASSNFSCRSQSALSVFARRFRPRLPAVSAGSARCARSPARSISSTTKRQPVVPSSANSASRPANCSSHSRTAPRVAGTIRPRLTSPDSRSSVVYVICLRCTSNATTIVIGTSSSSVDMNDTACVTRLSRGGLTTCHLYGAPWLQRLAISGKSPSGENRQTKPNPLRPVATACLRRSMVRRGRTPIPQDTQSAKPGTGEITRL